MNKLSHFIVNHKALIGIIFVVLIIASIVGMFFVNQNSDIISYLDDASDTAKGQQALMKYFGINNEASVAVMSDDMEVLTNIAAKAAEFDVVKNVMWYGNFVQLEEMVEQNPKIGEMLGDSVENIKNKFVKITKDGEKIYLISFFFTDKNDGKVNDALNAIENELNAAQKSGSIKEFALGGTAIDSKKMMDSSLGELPMYLILAVVILIIILGITTRSWLEPFIFLATLGISILLNMGSNVLFPDVSIITYSSSAILQLALAMDYTIFLMHCFYHEREKSPLLAPKLCMERALPKTLASVAASALTTIGGFIALFAMNFGIGIDLGRVLAKGVLLSLLTVIFLQPIMVLALSKPIAKTQHRYFKPQLVKTTKASIKGRVPIIIVALLLVVPCFIGQLSVPLSYVEFNKPIKEMSQTQEVIASSSTQVIMVVPYSKSDPTKNYLLKEKLDSIEGVENGLSFYSLIPEKVHKVVTLLFPQLVSQLDGQLFSNGYTLYIYEITTGLESETTQKNLALMMSAGESIFGSGNAYVTGLAQGAKDLAEVTPRDFLVVSLISALIIFLIMCVTFRSIKSSLILLLVIELGIWINLSIVTLLGSAINFMTYVIISSVQLGATVDYAILAMSKYREAKEDGCKDTKQALIEGFRRATPSILVSAAILIAVCVSVYAVSSNLIIGQVTMLIAAGALMSTLLVLFLLPAVLYVSETYHERRIERKLVKLGLPPLSEPKVKRLKMPKWKKS